MPKCGSVASFYAVAALAVSLLRCMWQVTYGRYCHAFAAVCIYFAAVKLKRYGKNLNIVNGLCAEWCMRQARPTEDVKAPCVDLQFGILPFDFS